MIDHILSIRLKPALDRLRRRRMKIGYLIGTAVALAVVTGMVLYARSTPGARGMNFEVGRWLMFFGTFAFGAVGALIGGAIKPNIRRVAQQVEEQFPELNGRLTTAVQQTPGDDGTFTFLQEHLAAETIHHSTENDWKMIVPEPWMRRATVAHAVMLAACLGLWMTLPRFTPAAKNALAGLEESTDGVTVTPGDTEMEKGTALVMLARFDEPVPGAAELVLGESTESERRLPLARTLGDPVFGGSVPEVQESFTYKVAWEGGSTRAYKVKVYEFPKLDRSDASLTYPGYTKLAPKRIEDTRHISAVEGTKIDLELALNKPVASAVLEPRKGKDVAAVLEPLTLEVSPDKAAAILRGHVPAQSARYELVLTDADGRRSKQAVPFSFDVLPNRVPELKLASPKGDQKPSALQEIQFDGTVWDDFGVVACGLEVETPGGKTVTVEFGKDVPGKEKRAFQQLVRMEELKAVPDQLFAWHTWADDFGPDGKVRRTRGDLYFAEVRAFEQIFRQGESMTAEQQRQQQQQQEQQQQGQQGQAAQLVQLQKQIITATWKLAQRSGTEKSSKLAEDLKVVRDSQEDARKQAEAAAGGMGASPLTASLWQGALQHMQQALERLEKATEAPPEVTTALGPEQAAYQALLKLQAKEFQVARQNRQQQQQQQSGQQQGQNQGDQEQQRQLDQLDLAKNDDRYETQREAQAQQSAERREQAQVMNRLKELAQRQQDVNEKLKELQSALNEAKTQEEKEAAKRELKRLEEEQRQMLADADELRQRMEQQQNQSENSEQREQLEQARENMQQAAEAAAQGQASQALASGKRAGEQMEQMKEEMRKQSAGAFEEELRQMRADARELARKQQEIAKEMKGEKGDPSAREEEAGKQGETNRQREANKAETANNAEKKEAPSLGTPDEDEKLAEELRKQEERTGDLVERAQELSEQAEAAEPLLSRKIYDAARQFTQNDAGVVKQLQQELFRENRSTELFDELKQLQERERGGRALRLASELQRQNRTRDAARITDKAGQELNRLRDGIEQAAESVLGDDTESLRLAEQQLRDAAEAMRREMEEQTGRQPDEQNRQANAGRQRQGQPQEGQRQGSGQRNENGEQQPREGEPQNTAQARNENQNEPREGEPQPQEGQQNGRQPQGQEGQAQASARQPGQRQGNGRGQPQNGEQQEPQPNERQPGEPNPETAQNEPREGQQPREGEGAQRQPGERQGQREGRQPGENPSGENRENQDLAGGDRRRAQREPGGEGGGAGGGPLDFEAPRGTVRNRPVARDPLTGEGFTNWSDRLREAEELVDETELRNEIAKARERARQMKLDMRHEGNKPNWDTVELEVVKPLVEVRDRLRQELARRESDKALVPVDRDPVPAQFSENVRRYYEQLGKDQ